MSETTSPRPQDTTPRKSEPDSEGKAATARPRGQSSLGLLLLLAVLALPGLYVVGWRATAAAPPASSKADREKVDAEMIKEVAAIREAARAAQEEAKAARAAQKETDEKFAKLQKTLDKIGEKLDKQTTDVVKAVNELTDRHGTTQKKLGELEEKVTAAKKSADDARTAGDGAKKAADDARGAADAAKTAGEAATKAATEAKVVAGAAKTAGDAAAKASAKAETAATDAKAAADAATKAATEAKATATDAKASGDAAAKTATKAETAALEAKAAANAAKTAGDAATKVATEAKVAAEKGIKPEDLQKAIDKAVTSTFTNNKEIKDAVAKQVSEAFDSKETKENVSRSVASAVNAKDVSEAVARGISGAVDDAIKKSVDKAAEKGAEKASATFRGAVVNELGKPVENVNKKIDTVSADLKGLTRQLKQETARQDVALVLYHSNKLDANKFLPAVKEVAAEVPSPSHPGHRLGIFAAWNDRVEKTLRRPQDRDEGSGRVPLDEQQDARELSAKLRPPFDDFGKGPTAPWQRRCVLVVSASSSPPAPDAAAWKGVGVDVILIGRDFAKQSWNVAAWTDFCRAHRGSVVTLGATNKAPALPDVDRDELKYHLLRLTAPR